MNILNEHATFTAARVSEQAEVASNITKTNRAILKAEKKMPTLFFLSFSS